MSILITQCMKITEVLQRHVVQSTSLSTAHYLRRILKAKVHAPQNTP